MKPVISIYEHQRIPFGNISEGGSPCLTNSQIRELGRLQKHLPKKSFEWSHNSIKWGSFVGLVPLTDVVIEVSPKLHSDKTDVTHGREVFLKMLAETGIFKLHQSSRTDVGLHNHSILDIFIQEFCNSLRAQVQQGVDRSYQQDINNLPVLRGKLLFDQHLKHNLASKNLLYCQYDELSHDTLLNQLILATLAALQTTCNSQKIKQAVIELRKSFDDVLLLPPSSVLANKVHFDRTNERFVKIEHRCRQLLSGLYPDVTSGENAGLGLLFNMNKLFETWLETVFRKISVQSDLSFTSQRPVKYVASRETDSTGETKAFRLQPDLMIYPKDGIKHHSPILIADAKWKLISTTEKGAKISPSDIHQIQSYASIYRADHVALVFPKQNDKQKTLTYQMNDKNRTNLLLVFVAIDTSANALAIELQSVFQLSQYKQESSTK